jgi:hypothetical protein
MASCWLPPSVAGRGSRRERQPGLGRRTAGARTEPTDGPRYETPGSQAAPPVAIFHLVRQKQIVACSATGEIVLDQGEGIELKSLELSGSTLSWTDSGERRTSRLP